MDDVERDILLREAVALLKAAASEVTGNRPNVANDPEADRAAPLTQHVEPSADANVSQPQTLQSPCGKDGNV